MSVYVSVYCRLSFLTSSLLLLTHIHIHTHIHQLTFKLKKTVDFIREEQRVTTSSQYTHTHTHGEDNHG